MELLSTLLATVVALGLLVTIHEYGHFWVARRCGIKVELAHAGGEQCQPRVRVQ